MEGGARGSVEYNWRRTYGYDTTVCLSMYDIVCVCVCLHSQFCIDGSLPLLFQLISRLASLFGRELCMKYFVPLFPSLGSDTMFHVRKVRTGGRKRGRGERREG